MFVKRRSDPHFSNIRGEHLHDLPTLGLNLQMEHEKTEIFHVQQDTGSIENVLDRKNLPFLEKRKVFHETGGTEYIQRNTSVEIFEKYADSMRRTTVHSTHHYLNSINGTQCEQRFRKIAPTSS